MKKTKILIVEPPGLNGVNWWRIHHPFMHIARQYGEYYDIAKTTKQVTNEELMYVDVVFCSRPCTPTDVKILQRAKKFGCKILLDFDDNILNLPIGHTLLMDFAEFAPHIRECMALADWIWCSTEPLQYVCDALPRSEVIRNAVTTEQIEQATFAPWTRTAAWRGTHAQFHDLYDQRAFFEANYQVPDFWRWLGYIPPFAEVENTVFEGQRWTQDTAGYILDLPKLKCNWLWKPMKEHPFNESKSKIAWIEATLSGAVCVTNFAGRPQWELCTTEFIEQSEALELWEASKQRIRLEYNLFTENAKRHESIQRLAVSQHAYQPRILSTR